VIARVTRARFIAFSAVLAGIKEIREVRVAAEDARRRLGRRTILFIDEIHRFNKAQQDAFLPHVEAGDIVLIGATTENPSFEVNAALLSRSRCSSGRSPRGDPAILRRARGSRAGWALALVAPDALDAIARRQRRWHR
jgi:replication-associated recombination protein RarA